MVQSDNISTIYLIRHGDRQDYANPSWIEQAQKTKTLITDPPLSPLGHKQARETSLLFDPTSTSTTTTTTPFKKKPSVILASPYLRTIQTAVPTSEILQLPINIEEGLSEAQATPTALPTLDERFAYFPQIDITYRTPLLRIDTTTTNSSHHRCIKTDLPCESFPTGYIRRMDAFRKLLERTYRGKTIVCFSHAASVALVALVASLLRCSLKDLKLAPCGVYMLQKRLGEEEEGKDDGAWEMIRNGSSNAGYISENCATTYPWGFSEKYFRGNEEGIDFDYFVEKEEKKLEE